MTKLLLKYFPAFFIIIAFIFIFIENMHKPRILILYSSHVKNDWTMSVDRGINNVLSQKEYLYVRRHYMKIQNEQNSAELEKQFITAVHVVTQWHPDLIISFGPKAQHIVSRYYRNDPKIKIVFGGISKQEFLDFKYNTADNITGVIEDLPFNVARDIFATIFKNKSKIFYLSASDDNSKNRLDEFNSLSWKPFSVAKARNVSTFLEWQKSVLMANKTSEILLIRSYNEIVDKNHKKIPPKKLIKWTLQSSQIPVIGINTHFVRDGGGIGIAPNGELNGENVAQLALKVIDQKKIPSNIPIMNNVNFIPYLRESELRKEIPDVYIPSWYIAFSQSEHAYYE